MGRWIVLALLAAATVFFLWSRKKTGRMVKEIVDDMETEGLSIEDLRTAMVAQGSRPWVIDNILPDIQKELERRRALLAAGLEKDLRAAGLEKDEAKAAVGALQSRTLKVLA